MRHLFVTKEIALLAKEVGFDEPCLAIINREGAYRIVVNNPSDRTKDFSVSDSGKLKAPTWQQLIDWLRINHSNVVSVSKNTFKYRDDEYTDGVMFSDTDYYSVLSDSLIFWLNNLIGIKDHETVI